MHNHIIALIAALAISIPATCVTAKQKSPKLSKCDGKKRRPANPYGSILPSVDPQAEASTPAGQTLNQDQDQDQEPKREDVDVFPSKSSALPKPATRPSKKTKIIVPPISIAQPKRVHQS